MDQVEPDFSAGRIFAPSKWNVLKAIPLELALIFVTGYGIYKIIFGNYFEQFPQLFVTLLILILVLIELLFIFVTISAPFQKTILFSNAIEERSLFYSRRLERSEISGFSIYTGKRATITSFIPRDTTKKTMSVYSGSIPNAIITEWIHDIPNLTGQAEAVERKRVEDAISHSAAPGDSPAEKIAWFDQIHKAQTFLVCTTLIVSTLFFFGIGTAYLAAILFALPWIGIVALATSRGTLTAFISTTDPRPSVAWMIGIPALIMWAGPPYWTNLVGDGTGPVLVCLLSGGVLTTILHAIDHSSANGWRSWVFYIVFFTILLGASCYEFNVELDNAVATEYSTTIIAKRIAHGRRSSDHFYVTLGPWDDVTNHEEPEVSEGFYDRAQVGSTVRVTRHPGAFGYPWFTIAE